MLSLSIDSIFWYCFVVMLLFCSSHVPLFRGIPTDLPVFRCSASFTAYRHCSSVRPMLCWCFVFCSSVFRCSWLCSMPKQKTVYGVFFSLSSCLRSFGFFHYFGMRVGRVLPRPYLMTLYIIFPIHVNFPDSKGYWQRTELLVVKTTGRYGEHQQKTFVVDSGH